MSRLFILLFSVMTLASATACAQAQDTESNVEVVFTEDEKPDLAAMLEAMKAKEEALARQVELEKSETERRTQEAEDSQQINEALKSAVEASGETSTTIKTKDGKLDMEALLKEAKEKRDASATELAKEKAETVQEKAQTEILQEFVDIAEKPTD